MDEPTALTQATDGLALDKTARVILAVAFAFAAALRLWLCFSDDGIYWPDEIYQSLEPAHRLVFGYGLRPWEFIQGARNWAFPGFVAALLKGATLVLGDNPRHYLVAIRLIFSAISLLTAWGTSRLARAAGASQLGAALAGILFALSPATIYLAPRALSESASAVAVVWGLASLMHPVGSKRLTIIGASLLGLSVLFRLQNGLICLVLLGILGARRQDRRLAIVASVLGAWALVYGALDRMTWGHWFNSIFEYLNFNVVEGKSEQWGTSDPTYFFRVLWTSMPWIAAWVIPLSLAAARKAPGLFLIAASYIVIHSFVGHKELRFVLPALPVLFSLVGLGFDWAVLRFKLRPQWLATGSLLCGLITGSRFHQLTFGDLGQYGEDRQQVSAYDDFGTVNRLLLAAHDRPELCGLAVLAVPMSWTGGYSYLHRKVPMYSEDAKENLEHFNYAIIRGEAPERIVASEGDYRLIALPKMTCTPDPNYDWKLR